MNEFQGGRPTLVFVHGLSGSSSAWIPYEKDLESTFNILSFDLRGHGKSGKPKKYSDYKIDYFADDLNELTEYLKIDKFTLIGHSLGCLVVFAYLRKHQDRVSKVIFLSPNFSAGEMLSARIVRPFLSAGVAILRCFPLSGRARWHVDYSKYPNSGDWNIPRMIADIGNTSLHVYLYATKQAYDFVTGDFLSKIHIPALIVHGKKDTIFPVRYGVLVAKNIKGSKLVLLEDIDHILVLNRVADVSREIRQFSTQ